MNGKTFVYTGWALCAYEFMGDCEKDMIKDKFMSSDCEKDELLLQIMKNSKLLRKRDFLQESMIHFSKYLYEYEKNLIDNSYIPEITYEYIIEFSNSDKMQCNLDIIEYIIDEIKKLLNIQNNIIYDTSDIVCYEQYLQLVESRQLDLIIVSTI
jgi:hypothetical protein